MANKICAVHQLGLIPYETAWRLQDRLAEEIARGQRPATLLLLEHLHTFTFGRRGQPEHLLWDQAERQRKGVSVHWVDRGGDVTYHGPGQLVGYPLLPLGRVGMVPDPRHGRPRLPQADFIGYLRALEEVLMAVLSSLGLAARQIPGLTGVWMPGPGEQPPAKIAAIGIKVDARGVTRHGFALNVDPDMSYWEGIIGCGLKGHPVTSLARYLKPCPPMAEMMEAVEGAFAARFGYQTRAGAAISLARQV